MQGFPLFLRTPVIVLLTLQSWGSRVLEAPSPGGDPRILCPPGTQEGIQALFPTLQPWVLDGGGDSGTHCPAFVYPIPAMGFVAQDVSLHRGKVPLSPGNRSILFSPHPQCPAMGWVTQGITSHQVVLSSSCSLKGVPAVFHHLLAPCLEFRIFPEFYPL